MTQIPTAHQNYHPRTDLYACIATTRPKRIDPGRLKEIIGAFSGISDDIIDGATREGMSGFLFKALQSTHLSDLIPRDRLGLIQRAYYATVQKNLTLEAELQSIVEITHQRGINIVVLQGMGLIQTIYPDIGLRPMTDIDLWVPNKDFRACFEILKRIGYNQDPLYPGTFRNGAAVLDIHSHLFWAERIRSRKRILSVDERVIFDASIPLRQDLPGALILNPYDQVLYLGLHVLKHNADRLIWLVDIKLILERFEFTDWQKLMERSIDLGLSRSLTYILYLLDCLLRYSPPSEVNRMMEHHRPGTGVKWLLRRRIHRHALPAWSPLILFSSGMTLAKKLPFIWENLFPRPGILRQVFPESARGQTWPLYLKRFAQITGIRR